MKRIITIAGIFVLASGIQVKFTSGEIGFGPGQSMAPAGKWGTKIAHHLGGEARIVERNPAGRAVRQLERMVLSSVPFADINLSTANPQDPKLKNIFSGRYC